MNLEQASKHRGAFYIPNSSRDDLPCYFKDRGYKTGAEIGVFKGEYTEKFCQEGLEVYGVDPWLAYSGMGGTFERQKRMDRIHNEAKERLANYENVHLLKTTSMEAVRRFEDNSLDFVYIDGDHDFRHIAEDLYEWAKKVRPGGIVSGHDYAASSPRARNVVIHVKPVLKAYVKYFRVDKLYVIGEGVEEFPSWMFIR